MKKYKSNIICFLLGVLITSVISVSATVVFKAKDVSFNPSNLSWNVTNVEDAINDIFNTKSYNNTFDVLSSSNSIKTGITYTIKDSDLDYKSILVFASGINKTTSSTSYTGSLTITNDHIIDIVNESAYKYADGSDYVSNKMYIGKLDNIISGDTITVSGFYGISVYIIGVK